MNELEELCGFVRRHPFVSRRVLDEVYGQELVGSMLEASNGQLNRVELKGRGLCLADRHEAMATLMDVERAEMARWYVLRVMGREAVMAGLAPGFEADGEFMWKGGWWRVWVDPGGCAPEALGFVQCPPKEFGAEVQDLVVTGDASRMDSLARQVEMTWGGGKKVFVMHADGQTYRVARPRALISQRKVWKPYGGEELAAHIRRRQRGSHKRGLMASVAKGMEELDWGLLIEAGNLPLMTPYELAYLQTHVTERVRELIGRIGALEAAGLLATARSPIARDRAEGRKVVTSLGLEMLAAHWGTSGYSMMRMHPWPQVAEGKALRRTYALGWAGPLAEHYRMVRQFALALVHGARGVSNNLGQVQAKAVTTIGSRLLYRDRSRIAENQTGAVKPDGVVWVKVEQRGWLDGDASAAKTLCENTLWLEVDRGTVSRPRLAAKLDGYAAIWEGAKAMKPALVWLIDGSPAREVQILNLMRERGIDGWTVLKERVVLPEDDLWWVMHLPTSGDRRGSRVGLKYEAFGGMAPWRDVWSTTGSYGARPLLGVEPWKERELRRSPPRKGEQEWTRYKSA